MAFFKPIGLDLLLLAGGTYGLTNLVASVLTARKDGMSHVLLLPFAFATLHLSYGLGFLSGLIKFWNRWGNMCIDAIKPKSVFKSINREACQY